jgi:acetylornithine deacetylase/succinyl-diaminopimelate desuccinylase-like protein
VHKFIAEEHIMSDPRPIALEYLRSNRERFLEALKEYISIPSVSTDPACETEVKRAAEWTADHLRKIGIQSVGIYLTAGHPVVYGEWLGAGPAAPTVLVYGHYDVQPAEPLDLWQSDPFQAEVRGENLYGRGAADMKGQVLATMNAVEAVEQAGSLPINLKFLLEGEEEVGSPNLEPFIAANQEKLASAFALNPDTGMIAPDLPTITYALRGLAYFEVRVYGPDHDLHSGLYGGVVHNPAQALCELIAGMHDEQGRVTLPGFYDRVAQLSKEERDELTRLPMDEAFFIEKTGVPELWGEQGYSPVERIGARPTLEVNGLYSGFTGEGAKTVLPAWAMAKISTRLVPDQDPEEVHQLLREYFQANTPATVKVEVTRIVGSPASVSARHSPAIVALQNAMQQSWGKRPVFRREGGSVPVVGMFQKLLGIESINTGFSLPDDNAHGPNEKLHLPTWRLGTESLVHFIYNLGG